VQKCINFRRKLLYRPLGGKLINYKISEKTGEILCVIGGGNQLLVAWDNVLKN